MLFNSYTFIFAFLPFALLTYHGLRWAGFERGAILALTLLSLGFYGWWNPIYLLLLIPLTFANYIFAKRILACRQARPSVAKTLLISGLIGNLSVLGYFKYANFFIDNMNTLLGLNLFLAQIVLPLGISFFTFQKIAFLVDVYRGRVTFLNMLDFALFVSFFPQLIAGPIVHHSEVLPQLRQRGAMSIPVEMGVTIFIIGLAKKVLLADTAALYATPPFAAAASGEALGLLTAWRGALAYTLQLYFDFSGYSDMAIGAALLFGIRLPVNFNSPYKATGIIDFWRRWHITLSRFLRDYLYIPLGGNRHGKMRRYGNLLLTMLLGGLWHGANWTFVIWGVLHGGYLVANHAWHAIRPRIFSVNRPVGYIEVWMGRAITFIAITIAWVVFRAEDAATAFGILGSMIGLHDWGAAPSKREICVLMALLLGAFFAPNTQAITGYVGSAGIYGEGATPSGPIRLRWQPTLWWATIMGCLFALSVASLSRISEFIYFQF